MKSFKGKASALTLLKGGVSAVALTAMAATLITPAFAQDAAPATDGAAEAKEIVVVGVRRSLKTAQQIKQNADTIVDSITSTDIGSFPDKSVAEALQRVAGITVTRFAAATDTAHFSAEPSGVLVRGLQQVRSEFNGRDVFSANSSRGLSWGDVSPELMAGVDTYKNQTADLIEGGIAGSINLRTRLPFDSKGQLIALSIDESYGDLAKKWTPSVSGIYSNRWDTDLGEFGLMINGAYSDIATTSQGIQFGRMGIFCDQRPDNTDPTTCNKNQFGNDNNDAAEHNFAYIPVSTTYRDTNFDRQRTGISAAAQWESNDKSLLATLQYNTSSYENEWHEHFVGTTYFDVWAQPLGYQFSDGGAAAPLSGQSFTFDDQGLFQTGVLTGNHGWFGAGDTLAEGQAASVAWGGSAASPQLYSEQVAVNENGTAMFNACGPFSTLTCASSRQGAGVGTGTRYNHNEETTTDTSFNLRWIISDKLRANFDVQYVKAEVTNYDIEVDINSYANVGLDASGELPIITLLAPTNVNQSAGGLTNANNYYYNSVMDHTEDSHGTELASRFDLQYSRDEGWIDTIKVGVRYADREQKVNWSTYNWKNISNTYSSNAATWNLDTSARTGDPLYHLEEFGTDFMHQKDLMNQHEFIFFNYATLENRQKLSEAMSQASTGIGSWVPICDRTNEEPDSCYTAAERMDIEEESFAGYLQIKFGGNDKTIFGKSVTGNAGVRWVQTNITSTGGGIKYPDAFEYNQNNCDGTMTALQAAQAAANGQYAVFLPCVTHHSIDDIAFRDGAITGDAQFPAVVNTTHINWLPSFNAKLQLDDTWLMRFAYSRAMSRPDMGYLRNYFYVQGSALTSQEMTIGNPNVVLGTGTGSNPATNCAVGTACSYTGYRYTASSGNPYLKPTTADQYDLTFENYFASVGSFSFDLFYKKFYDYVQNGTRQLVTLTHGTAPTYDASGNPVLDGGGAQVMHDVTRDVQVTGPVNGQGASLKGFEVSYQRFFDFLPSPFNGLGIQANYTKIKNTGIKNAGLGSTSAGGGGGLGSAGGGVIAAYDNITVDTLEGLSDDSYNLIGMYEKGPWALRAAYNWRSKFLVTAADCCVGFPIWQKAIGYLDASLRYRVNDQVELSVQGSNLLDSNTVLLQQVDNRGTLMPNAWFKNDKRVQVGVRLKY